MLQRWYQGSIALECHHIEDGAQYGNRSTVIHFDDNLGAAYPLAGKVGEAVAGGVIEHRGRRSPDRIRVCGSPHQNLVGSSGPLPNSAMIKTRAPARFAFEILRRAKQADYGSELLALTTLTRVLQAGLGAFALRGTAGEFVLPNDPRLGI
jgi:hypothetical protein